MISPAEAEYRGSLSQEPDCIRDALEYVIPSDTTDDDPATSLTRDLCFATAHNGQETTEAFASRYPFMMDHSVRQVALVQEILNDPTIQAMLPDWFDLRIFSQGVVIADVGLAFVSEEEVKRVHCSGPKSAEDYDSHPKYGYNMALAINDLDTPETQFLAALIARHHKIQARNQYGLDWPNIRRELIVPGDVNYAVALLKPFDFIDDTVDRTHDSYNLHLTYEQLVKAVVEKFTGSYSELRRNLGSAGIIFSNGSNPKLPNMIATRIGEVLLQGTEIGNVYRSVVSEMAEV
jgi:hypothetical protein